jgi:hypothetical protein
VVYFSGVGLPGNNSNSGDIRPTGWVCTRGASLERRLRKWLVLAGDPAYAGWPDSKVQFAPWMVCLKCMSEAHPP